MGVHRLTFPHALARLRSWAPSLCGALLACALLSTPVGADETAAASEATKSEPNLVKQANAPLSSIFQVRFFDTFTPDFSDEDGNVFGFSITMPLPKQRLLPISQLSLLTVPAAITPPDSPSGFGDIRLVDVAVFNPRRDVILGVGPTLVFPTASEARTGQKKWQAGPALVAAWGPRRWLLGFLAQNPISFAGDDDRADVNALFLQPVLTYQLASGWFIRSVPQMVFNWETDEHFVPLDLGVGRVFKIGRQRVNMFVEPFWRASGDEPSPDYGVTFGLALLYPDFWGP